jgi:hypothetical protein
VRALGSSGSLPSVWRRRGGRIREAVTVRFADATAGLERPVCGHGRRVRASGLRTRPPGSSVRLTDAFSRVLRCAAHSQAANARLHVVQPEFRQADCACEHASEMLIGLMPLKKSPVAVHSTSHSHSLSCVDCSAAAAWDCGPRIAICVPVSGRVVGVAGAPAQPRIASENNMQIQIPKLFITIPFRVVDDDCEYVTNESALSKFVPPHF